MITLSATATCDKCGTSGAVLMVLWRDGWRLADECRWWPVPQYPEQKWPRKILCPECHQRDIYDEANNGRY